MTTDLGAAMAGLPGPPGDDEGYRAEVRAIARAYNDAAGPVMRLAEWAGARARGVLSDLPLPASAAREVEAVAHRALLTAYAAAMATHGGKAADRGWVDRQLSALSGDGFNRLAATVSGAVGGSAGLASALVELPATTTLILRSIQEIAVTYGEDLSDEAVRLECLAVFAQGGPLHEDDETEYGFFAARVGATQLPLAAAIAAIAPRFGILVGEKLAAQAAPVLGAVLGAAFNSAFMAYFQKMAHVRFRLRQLQRERGSGVAEDFLAALGAARARGRIGRRPA